jgi:hypothetical protein
MGLRYSRERRTYSMSRKVIVLRRPVVILGVEVDSVVYGNDHALGHYIQGLRDGEYVLDRDASGMGLAGPNGSTPLSYAEFRKAVGMAKTFMRI